MAKPKRSGGAGPGYTVAGVDPAADDAERRVEIAQGWYAHRLERAGLTEQNYLVNPRLLWTMHKRVERTRGSGQERTPDPEALEQVMAAQIEAARWAETQSRDVAGLTVQAALVAAISREEPFEGGAAVNDRTAAAVAQTMSLAVQGAELEPAAAMRQVRDMRCGVVSEPDFAAFLEDAHTAGRAAPAPAISA